MGKVSLITKISILVTTFCFSDYFPIEKGNMWEFNYLKITSNNNLRATTKEMGTVTWAIVNIDSSIGEANKYSVTIEQKYQQSRRIYVHGTFIGAISNPDYDSTYQPPRVEENNFILRSSGSGNELKIKDDSCWLFIHSAESEVPDSLLMLREVNVYLNNDSMQALEVVDMSCRYPKVIKTGYYTLADNIGPVAFKGTSSYGFGEKEEWTFKSAHVGGSNKIGKKIRMNDNPFSLKQLGQGRYLVNTAGKVLTKVEIITINGIKLHNLSNKNIERNGSDYIINFHQNSTFYKYMLVYTKTNKAVQILGNN